MRIFDARHRHIVNMSHGEMEVEERPKKKRRFFVDDVDEPALNPEPSLPDELAPPQPLQQESQAVGFEALESIVGEQLSKDDMKKLE
jgi:hypothetical protein